MRIYKLKKISWQNAVAEGLRIHKPRPKMKRTFRDLTGETAKEKAYWVLFTLKATHQEVAEVFDISIGKVNKIKKKMGF